MPGNYDTVEKQVNESSNIARCCWVQSETVIIWGHTPPEVGAADASSAIANPMHKINALATAHCERKGDDFTRK